MITNPARLSIPDAFRRLLRGLLLVVFTLTWGAATRAADAQIKVASAVEAGAPLAIHVVSGSKEYQSEASLKPFLADLERQYRVTVAASWGTDGGESLDNLSALKDADVLLLFARRMKLPEDQMKAI